MCDFIRRALERMGILDPPAGADGTDGPPIVDRQLPETDGEPDV